MVYFGSYVTTTGARNVKRYRYQGSDNSILYRFVLNPMYNYLIEFFPLWMAPNLITIIGFAVIILNHVTMWYYSPHLIQEAPRWAYVANAAGLLFYQAFDGLDGKQARRTGSSTPLGLLFDHGCDAMNVTVSALTLASSLGLGATWKTVLLWATGSATFFAATWEEYYTKELNLPFINGPDEGLWICAVFHLTTALFGPQFWSEDSGFGFERNMYVLGSGLALAVVTIVSNCINVYRCVRHTKAIIAQDSSDHSDAVIESSTMLVAFTRATPFVAVVSGMFAWVYYSPSDILDLHPRLVLWTCGLLVSKLLTGLMVAHICDEVYRPFSKTIAVITFVGFHALYSIVMYEQHIQPWHEKYVLYEFFALSAASYAHMVVSLIWELTTILKIKCFVIPLIESRKSQ